MSWSQKSSLPESHGKSSDDLALLRSYEGVEEDVEANANGFEIPGETQPSVVLVCASRNCSFTGSFCSNNVSHKLILLGNGTI
jgi:hypothetical protein